MKQLISILTLAMSFTILHAQELTKVTPRKVMLYQQQDRLATFDINQAVSNTTELRAVVMNDECIATLILKEAFLNSIKKTDLKATATALSIKLGNAEELDNDFIKLKCTKDAFLRWQILKNNNYKFLNNK